MEHDAYLRGMRILDLCKEVDLALIMNTSSVDPNFLYVTGFSSGLFEYSFLIVKRRKGIRIRYAHEIMGKRL